MVAPSIAREVLWARLIKTAQQAYNEDKAEFGVHPEEEEGKIKSALKEWAGGDPDLGNKRSQGCSSTLVRAESQRILPTKAT